MKKLSALLLLAALLLSLVGCGSSSAVPVPETVSQSPGEASTAQNQPVTAQNQPTIGTTQPPSAEEEALFLKVSAITFSLVGEQEDIYLGMAPRELVTWESEDPSVISVENGVLTANAVGTTTIHASYGDQQLSVTAGCLAQTQEELESLDGEILGSPKRLPPEVDLEEPCTDFDSSAIMGDSITYFLWQEESQNDYLGGMTFVTRQGISVNSVVRRFKNLFFRGKEMFIEDIAAECDAERIYIMLGCLDFQVPAAQEQLIDNWNIMLDRIGEKCPDKQIVIVSNIPSSVEKTFPENYNESVARTNGELRELAAERGVGFLDLGYYIVDHQGRMPAMYTKDDYHMNADGSLAWMKILRYYACYELAGGTLS